MMKLSIFLAATVVIVSCGISSKLSTGYHHNVLGETNNSGSGSDSGNNDKSGDSRGTSSPTNEPSKPDDLAPSSQTGSFYGLVAKCVKEVSEERLTSPYTGDAVLSAIVPWAICSPVLTGTSKDDINTQIKSWTQSNCPIELEINDLRTYQQHIDDHISSYSYVGNQFKPFNPQTYISTDQKTILQIKNTENMCSGEPVNYNNPHAIYDLGDLDPITLDNTFPGHLTYIFIKIGTESKTYDHVEITLTCGEKKFSGEASSSDETHTFNAPILTSYLLKCADKATLVILDGDHKKYQAPFKPRDNWKAGDCQDLCGGDLNSGGLTIDLRDYCQSQYLVR